MFATPTGCDWRFSGIEISDRGRVVEKLTFQDGFYFGCGFFLAGIIAYLAIMVVLLGVFLVATFIFGGGILSLLA